MKSNGLLICEFGANGNIATIENAFISACQDFEYNIHLSSTSQP